MSDELKGMLLGVIGVAIFSVTLPATRIAVLGGLDAVFVGLGRAAVVKQQPRPGRRQNVRGLRIAAAHR